MIARATLLAAPRTEIASLPAQGGGGSGQTAEMRIGINGSGLIALGQPAAAIVDHAVAAEADGFASYWLAQLAAPDAITVLGVIGTRTSTIELGTAVVPTWPRHPLML